MLRSFLMIQFDVNSQFFQLVIIPLLIFVARMTDVSLGTIRIIFISRGMRFLAAILGFVEILVWLVAISQVMQHLNNVVNFFAYAGGFALGNFVGMTIEEKLAMGMILLRAIVQKDSEVLVKQLHDAGFGVTSVSAEGSTGPVKVIYTIIKRKDLKKAVRIIKQAGSKTFYSVEDIRAASRGIFPAH